MHPKWIRLAGLSLVAVAMAGCGVGGAAPAASSPAVSASPSVSASASAGNSASASASGSARPSASGSASASASAASNGQLGMILEVNNAGWQQVLNSPAKTGMVIVFVMPNQPAAKAGLKAGDVVTAMNGTPVANSNVTALQIGKMKVGDKVSLDVERSNGSAKVDLVIDPATQIDLKTTLDGAVSANPNSAAPYFLRATYGDKDGQSALNDLNKAIDIQPSFVSAYVVRGTLREDSDANQAMADFNKAISLDPNYEPAYVNRSVLYSQQKNYDKALQDDQKAASLDPTDPAAYSNLGIGLVNTGKSQDGLSAEDKALQLDPQFGPALLYRGLIYHDQSKTDLQNASKVLTDPKLRAIADQTLSKMS